MKSFVLLALAFAPAQRPVVAPAPQTAAAAVTQEWFVRAAALDPSTSRQRLLGMLAAEDWTQTYAALDALGRSPEGASFALESVDVTGLIAHAHPSVRAAAWRLLLGVDAARLVEWEVPGLPAQPTTAELHGWTAWQALGVRGGATESAGEPGAVAARAEALLIRLQQGGGVRAGSASLGGLLEPEQALATLGPGAGQAQASWLCPSGEWNVARFEVFAGAWLRHPSGADLLTELRTALLPQNMARPGSAREPEVLLGLVEGLAAVLRLPVQAPALAGAMPPGDHLGEGPQATRSRSRREGFLNEATERAGPQVGQELVRLALGLDPQDPRRELILQAAARALPPAVALPLALDLSIDEAFVLWRSAEGAAPLALDLLLPWLQSDVAEPLRFAAAGELARGLQPGARDRALALLPHVTSSDSGLGEASFRWLCAVAGTPILTWEELFEEWKQLPRSTAIERLEHLPRSRSAPPFRPFLTKLLDEPDQRTPAHVELLRGSAASDPAGRALNRVLEGELRRALQGELPGRERRAAIATAYACLLALEPGGRPAASLATDLDRLALAHQAGVDQLSSLGERLIAGLAKTREGRVALGWQRVERLPRRLRIEGFLQLASALARGAEDAADLLEPYVAARLMDAYGGCDEELKLRLLGALHEPRLGSSALLADQAQATGFSHLVAEAALDALVARQNWPVVESVLGGAGDYERRRAAARALGRAEAGAEPERLLRGTLSVGPPATEGPEREFELSLLEQLLVREAWEPSDAQRLWAGPLASAERDLAQRQRGLGLGSADFRWRGELRVIARLAAAGLLDPAVNSCDALWRLDGRFLEAAAQAAEQRRAGSGGGLARVALVALAGEATERAGALAQVRARGLAFDAAVASSDPVAAAFHADRLALRLRVGGAPAREIVSRGRFPGAFEAHRFAQSERLAARARAAREAGRSAAAERLEGLARMARGQ